MSIIGDGLKDMASRDGIHVSEKNHNKMRTLNFQKS